MTNLKQNVDDIYSKGFNSAEQSNSVYNQWAEYDEQVLGEGRWTGHSMGASYVIWNYTPDVRVCDLGCGTGAVGKLLKTANYNRVWGFDISKTMIVKALPYYKDVQLINIVEQPYPGEYDVVTAIGVFTKGHLDATPLENLSKCLVSKGKICTTTPITINDYNYEEYAGWNKQTLFTKVLEKPSNSWYENGKQYQHNFCVWEKNE